MPDPRHLRITRELSLAAFDATTAQASNPLEPWVTDRLVQISEEGDTPAGETLFARGDPPDSFYILRKGRVRLAGGASGPQDLEGPCIVGMIDLLLDRPRAGAALALSDVQFLKVRVEGWFDLLEDSFTLARASVMAMVRTVAALQEKAWAGASPRTRAGRGPSLSLAPISMIERLGVLMDTPLLRGAGGQALSDLASMCEEVSFAPGETLGDGGGPRDRVFICVSGEVEAWRDEPHVAWRGGPGQIVCDLAWIADADMRWQARAVTPARALKFRVEDWFDLMEEHFEMVRSTLAALALQRETILAGD